MKGIKKKLLMIHRWLGFISGLPVFVVAITGCIYAFQDEIQRATQSYRYVDNQKTEQLLPSQIAEIAYKALPNKHLHAVMMGDSTEAAKAIFYSFEEWYYYFVYVDQYSGQVLKVKDEFADFFRIVLDGHFYFWLPPEIGQPVVAWSCVVFFTMLVTGLILWWPKNRKASKQRFTISWRSRWRRKNFDLHAVVGFYISWLALILVVTGLYYGFVWVRDSLYFIASGGDDFVEYYTPTAPSHNTFIASAEAKTDTSTVIDPLDRVYLRMRAEYPEAAYIEVHPPEVEGQSIAANANPDAATYWKIDYRYFDPKTMEELPVTHIWNKLEESSGAQVLMRMNYDIHVGAIWGLPGKILAFLLSLTIASLPVTGVLMYIGRRQK